MTHNLVPPFLLREAGLIVNETPKIQVVSPDVLSDHSIYFDGAKLRVPLALWGIFSYFPTRQPTLQEVHNDETEVLLISPDGNWNPHTDVYARNEENMLDHLGNITDPRHRPWILLADIDSDDAMIASYSISSAESERIDQILEDAPVIDHDGSKFDPI
jgi:hypothetical protein